MAPSHGVGEEPGVIGVLETSEISLSDWLE
jgi:hypothetical protein